MKILFVTWDGPQANYLESLFLPIFRGLAARGFAFRVLQFTWADGARIARTRESCAAAGIGYEAVPILRRPRGLGAVVSVLRGLLAYRRSLRRDGIDVVMPRSTVPGLLVLWSTAFGRRPIVFDADGLAIDERVEFAGQRPGSWSHRWQRDIEAQLVRESAVVLTRTAQASRILLARAGAGTDPSIFHVVGNGRDADLFAPGTASTRAQARADLGIDGDAPVLVYAGSIGPQYCLDEMAAVFACVLARRPDAVWLLLAQDGPALRAALAAHGIPESALRIQRVEAQAVPGRLACGDAGLSLRRPGFAMQGVAPVKLGEYLLCGLPVLATAGIGESDRVADHAGQVLQAMSPAELSAAADWVVDVVLPQRDAYRDASRALGVAHFSLDAAVGDYATALAGVSHGQ